MSSCLCNLEVGIPPKQTTWNPLIEVPRPVLQNSLMNDVSILNGMAASYIAFVVVVEELRSLSNKLVCKLGLPQMCEQPVLLQYNDHC